MKEQRGTVAIIEVRPPDTEEPQERLRSLDEMFSYLEKCVSANGSLWVFTYNGYYNGQLLQWPPMLAEYIRQTTNFRLKNILILYAEREAIEGKVLTPAYSSVLFMVKSLKDYIFDKTPIREPHIFKGIEWGKRELGTSGYHKEKVGVRYPSKGRDPGNVFYKTKRNAEGYILDIHGYPTKELFEKLIKLSSYESWNVLTNMQNGDLELAVKKAKRNIQRLGVAL